VVLGLNESFYLIWDDLIYKEKYLKGVVDNSRYLLSTKMASRIFIMSGIAFVAFVAMLAVSLMWWFSDYYYALEPLTGM